MKLLAHDEAIESVALEGPVPNGSVHSDPVPDDPVLSWTNALPLNPSSVSVRPMASS